MKKLIWMIAIFFCTLIATSCFYMRKPKLAFHIAQLDTTIKATKIHISELALNYKKYQGRYIETTGTFHEGFEEFAIYTDRNIEGETGSFWLGLNKDLNIDNKFLDLMNGRKIRIKGMVDTTSKGHLNSYLATIKNIYSWVEE